MKKSLVVLTILVLVAGFAFAAVTGTIEARYTFDFTGDEKTLEYDVYGTSSKVSFTISTEQVKVDGSNKPYATVTVDVVLSAKIDEVKNPKVLVGDDYYITSWGELDNFDLGVKLSDFRIVGENWEVDFLKAVAVGDYAKSAWEVGTDKKAIDAPWNFGKTKGVTLTYDGYKLGLSAERREKDEVYSLNVNLRSESKEIEFAEGIKGQVAVGIGASKAKDADMKFNFGVSAKAAYEKDDLAVNGAADLQYYNEKFNADVAVKVAVKPVTVDAYYATSLKEERLHSVDLLTNAENVVSLKVVADIEPVKVTVFAEDLANSDRLLAVKEEGKFGALTEDAQFGIYPTIDKVPFLGSFIKSIWFANAGVHYDIQENLSVNAHVGYQSMDGDLVIIEEGKFHNSDLVVKVGAEYKLEKATITGDLYVGKSFRKVGEETQNSDLLFGGELVASSDKLVENAVLTAKLHLDKNGVISLYDDTLIDAYAGDPEFAVAGKNYFQVSCKVAF